MAPYVDRWSRRFVATGVVFLVIWQAVSVLGIGRRTSILLAIYGFVLHVVFGKAYTLVPSYFDSSLQTPRALPLHLLMSGTGTALLATGSVYGGPYAALGSVLWSASALLFVGTLFWSVRGNMLGLRTGTSDVNSERRGVDRYSNLFVPVALLYLAFGSYELFSVYTALPGVMDGYLPRVSHLLAAGFAALLLFALGFRLLPRFLVEHPPKPIVAVVLPSGAVAPILLAALLGDGLPFVIGAILEATAVTGFAVAVTHMYFNSNRDRIGFYSILPGLLAGVLAVSLGVVFALQGVDTALVPLHARLNLLGFLGFSIIGVTYQFYPPKVGDFYRADDTTALISIIFLVGGLYLEAVGWLLSTPSFIDVGRLSAFIGSLVYAYLLLGLFFLHRRK